MSVTLHDHTAGFSLSQRFQHSMQVALIADMHGNAVALRTVLRQIQEENPDRIVCLGDVAANGPQPSATLELVRELGCPVVMGNTDEALLTPEQIDSNDQYPDRIKDLLRWAAERLSDEHINSVRAFEPTVELQLSEDRQLLCYHGSPRSHSEGIGSTTPEDELDEWFADTDAEVLAGGHTHIQLFRQHDDAIVLNPGSVGLARELNRSAETMVDSSRAEYALLTDENGSLDVELQRTRVDGEAVREAAHESEMPHADWWAEGWPVGQ
jgi:putative phosphoesterase